jgi:hypothetical protein
MEEIHMRSEWKMALSGGAAWLVGTIYFYFRGAATFEHGPLVYGANALIIIAAYVAIFRALLARHGVADCDTGRAALFFLVPGMAGEFLALLNSAAVLPGMRPQSVVIYAAFLFAGYASVGCYAVLCVPRKRAAVMSAGTA